MSREWVGNVFADVRRGDDDEFDMNTDIDIYDDESEDVYEPPYGEKLDDGFGTIWSNGDSGSIEVSVTD